MTLIKILVLVAISASTSYARAEIIEGEACEMKARFNEDVPRNCSDLLFVRVSDKVAPTGVIVDNPDPACNEPSHFTPSYTTDLVKIAVAYYTKNKADLKKETDNLNDRFAKDVNLGLTQEASKYSGDFAAFILRNMTDRTSFGNCHTVIALLPASAQVVGYRLIRDDLDAGPGICQPNVDCRFSKFNGSPQNVGSGGVQAWSIVFNNWSHNVERVARLTLFYRKTAGPASFERM